MQALLSAFGIDWRLLLINTINFGLLLFILWKFLYGPLMRMLDARRDKIAEGVINAENAAQHLHEIESTRGAKLSEAGKEADAVVAQARSAGSAKEREIISAGETAAASIVKDAESQAKELKAQAVAESKQEVAKLIVLGMEKMLAQKKSA